MASARFLDARGDEKQILIWNGLINAAEYLISIQYMYLGGKTMARGLFYLSDTLVIAAIGY